MNLDSTEDGTHLLYFTSEEHKHVDGFRPNPSCKQEGNAECSANS